MSQRSKKWIWGGRIIAAVVLIGIGIWMLIVGLTEASAIGGAVGLLVAIAALVAPYLFPISTTSAPSSPTVVAGSGRARATAAGQANTGVQNAGTTGAMRVTNSGDASADGAGSAANTGIHGPGA